MTGCFSSISSMLFTFFNMKRNTFDTFFNFFGSDAGGGFSLFELIRALGFSICILIVLVRLLGNLLSSITEEYEDPVKLALRAILAFILVAYSARIVDLEFGFMQKPFSSVRKLMSGNMVQAGGMKADLWDRFGKALTGGLGTVNGVEGVVDQVVINLLTFGCLLAIFSSFIKLSIEVAERYVVICISLYMAPLAFATAASKNTVRIMQAYIRMVFCQLLLMIFNVIFVDGTILAIYNYLNSGSVVFKDGSKDCPVFVFCILLLAFITAGQKMDSYMRGIGLDTVQTGSLFDEIRAGVMTAAIAGRSIAGAVHAAGSMGRALANGISRVTGHSAPNSNGRTSPVKENIANAGRSAAASMAQTMSQSGNAKMQSMAQKSAQNQIRSGAFNGLAGESNKSIQKATETAIGAGTMAKMGIDPSTLSGKNGQIGFKTKNGASGMLSFEPKNGNGWHELKDENGNGMNAWVKGSSNLGISGAPTGTHQKLSDAIGSKAGAALAGSMIAGQMAGKINLSSMEAISLGNGEFSLVGKDEKGQSASLGRIIPAEVGEKTAGALMAENEFGGKVGFLPQTDTAAAMNGKFVDDGMIGLNNGMAVPSDSVQDALAGAMERNNIAEGTAMLGFNSDGNSFTASFADPVSGTREITGSVADLLGQIDSSDAMVDLSDGICASSASVQDALAGAMESNNIAEGAAMLGFNSDGDSFTASFADPENGIRSITGNTEDLVNSIGSDNIRQGNLNDCEWVGMNDLFDTNAYAAMTGETPKSVEFNNSAGNGEAAPNNFIVTNESGSQYILDQAATTGKYEKVIGSGSVIDNVPLSIQKMPKIDHGGYENSSGNKGRYNKGRKR